MKQTLTSLLILALFFLVIPTPISAFTDEDEEEDMDEPIIIPDTCARIDTAAIYVRMNRFDSQPVRSILIDNTLGLQPVDYHATIRFIRTLTGSEGLSALDGAYAGLLDPSTSESDSAIRVLQHEHEGYLSYAYGLQDYLTPLTIAAKFKADTSGFNATSVGTWFIGDYPSEGVLQAEVRAGGTSIDDAVPLATGALLFSIEDGLENGRMYSIPLSRPAAIYPDEEFYIIVTCPAGQTRPQGCVMNQDIRSVPGRYLLKSGDTWVDLQSMQGFSRCGWLMNVGESIQDTTAWLVPYDSISGSIPSDTIAMLNLLFRGTPELKGMRYAEVTVTVDDGCQTQEIIPVTLHVNDAPYFLNPPTKVVIPENSTQIYEIEIYDLENDSFTVEPVIGAKVASYALSGTKLTLTVAPKTGDAGIYTLRLRATDTYGESREMDIFIYVTVLEQLFDPAGFVFSFMGGSETFYISNLFRYVNGSGLAFQASVRDERIVRLERPDAQSIVLTPDELGSTYIDFFFIDDEGNSFTSFIPVTVGQCEDPSSIIVQKWNNILLVNNAAGRYSDEGYQWYRNKIPIPRATGQYYSAGNNAEDMLDFTATYYVRLVTIEGDTIYSCPQQPVLKSSATAKAYPNPVAGGELLNIETGFSSGGSDETLVQIYDFNGRIVQTGQFMGTTGTIRIAQLNSGYYMLQLSCKKESISYGLYVK